MHKDANWASLFLLVLAGFLILTAMDNPRLAGLHGTDIIRLATIGLAFGVAFGIQAGARVFARKVSQP